MEELKVIKDCEILEKKFKVYGTLENPLFLAKDVAEWISHSKVSMMLKSIDDEEKVKVNNVYLENRTGGNGTWFLTEDGVYEVLMQSRKPIAKQFKKEVKSILKQLRLTGGAFIEGREEEAIKYYFPNFSDDTKLAMVLDLHKQNENYRNMIAEQKPMVDFANHVSNTSDLIDMNKMAKLLQDEGIKIGRNRLFAKLRDMKILMSNNTPYQRYINDGYFKLKETAKTTPYGSKTFQTTMVTGKGQIYITEKIRNE